MRIFIIFLFFSNFVYSQEIQSDLNYSARDYNDLLKISNQLPISLPFFDDFSNKSMTLNNLLWQDHSSFLNRTYPINPPTIGVVTLDGLDSNGFAYNINISNSSGLADKLTSNPIDLSNSTNPLYLMFYYQPQGLGDNPQIEDSLILEFAYDSLGTEKWERVWSKEGTPLIDFQKTILMINDNKFFTDNFKFRFRNYATLSGNFDHWHLDYIKLAELVNASDTFQLNDVSFVFDSPSILKRYNQMPWVHFKDNINDEINDSLNILIRNNKASVNVDYQYNVYEDNLLIDHYPNLGISRNVTVLDYDSIGNYSFSNPPISINNNIFISVFNDSAEYTFEHILGTGIDDYKENDTLLFNQQFFSHFSYDDGTAESAYGINVSGALAAYQFKLNRPDTLRSIQIYFPQMLDSVNNIPFDLTIWSDNNGTPGDIIHQQIEYPVHTSNQRYFSYNLDSLFQLLGTFYVGWQQTSDDLLNIGFDRNNSANQYMFYNVAGTWNNSSFTGSWMIRPVLSMSNIVLHHEFIKNKISFYPNPAKEKINIISNSVNNNLVVYDLNGRVVADFFKSSINFAINCEFLNSGIYFLRINNELGVFHEKIIIK